MITRLLVEINKKSVLRWQKNIRIFVIYKENLSDQDEGTTEDNAFANN